MSDENIAALRPVYAEWGRGKAVRLEIFADRQRALEDVRSRE